MAQSDNLEKTNEQQDAEVKKEIHKDDDIVEEVKEPEIKHLKTKSIPAVVALLATLISAVGTFIQRISLSIALPVILASLIIFWIIGEIIKSLLDRIEIVVPDPDGEDSSTENEEGVEGENDEATEAQK